MSFLKLLTLIRLLLQGKSHLFVYFLSFSNAFTLEYDSVF